MLTSNKIFTHNNLINLLIALIPLSLILGNAIVNINVILICLVGILIYKFEIFKINKKVYQYLIYAFFLYLILITLFRNLPNLSDDNLYKTHIIKSFLFLRFLIFFLVINKLVERNNFNISLFYLSCGFFVFIVSVDILIQVIFGQNLLGNPILNRAPSGFFGVEAIAGGYIQKFSLFFLFYASLYKKNFKMNNYTILFFIFYLGVIYLTSNRMPTVLYVSSLAIFILFENKIKKNLIFALLSFVVIFTAIKYSPSAVTDFSANERRYMQFKALYSNAIEIIKKSPELFYYNTYDGKEMESIGQSGYLVHFNSGIQVWKSNKVFGGGLKSFRLNCTYGNNQTCNTHPHNYLIEILVDTGLVGFILIYLIFINFINMI